MSSSSASAERTPKEVRNALISEIRTLHERREPLNIFSVKRRQPELIRTVYRVTPYWGWKQALAEAGLTYKDINVEYDDKVNCAICGRPFDYLANHLIHTHETTPEHYKEKYNAPLVSEEKAAAHMLRVRKNPPVDRLPHWEAPWSPEYVLDRIAEYHLSGFSVNFLAMQTREQTLCRFAAEYFGNWDEALRKIGIDPSEIRERKPDAKVLYPNAESVIKAIRSRHEKKLPLNSKTMSDHAVKGNPLLHGRACELFSSWDAALEAAAIPSQRQRRVIGFPTKESVIAEIKRRAETGLSLELKILTSAGHEQCDFKLAKQAQVLFGSWNDALLQSGQSPHLRKRYPTRESVLEAILIRSQAGLPLTSTSLIRGVYTDVALAHSAAQFFGTWLKAIEQVGLMSTYQIQLNRTFRNLRKELRNRPRSTPRFTTKEAVIKEIKRRIKLELSVDCRVLTQSGHKQRDFYFVQQAQKIFGSWNKALIAANQLPRLRNKYSSPELVLAGLQKRASEGLSLTLNKVQRGSKKDPNLVHCAIDYFGSWLSAIEKAGLKAVYDFHRTKLR